MLLFLDLLLLGTIYVFDRPTNQITAYRGPFPVHRHVLSDLIDVEVKVTTDNEGDKVAVGSLIFRKDVPFPLNSFSTSSVWALFNFQRELRAFLPPSPERAARKEAERQAQAAKAAAVAAVPQALSALWKAKGTDAIRHPREAMTFVVQHLGEHESDPVIRGLMKTLPRMQQNPAAVARILQMAAQSLRERGNLAGAERVEEAARQLQAQTGREPAAPDIG